MELPLQSVSTKNLNLKVGENTLLKKRGDCGNSSK